MSIPTIEELVAPHLERLRREAEAKRGDEVGQVMLWFEHGSVFAKEPSSYRYVALVYYGGSASKSESGHGNDIDEAIAKCVASIKPLPDVAAVLGLAADGAFEVCPTCGVDEFATNATAHSCDPPMVPWAKCRAMDATKPCPMSGRSK